MSMWSGHHSCMFHNTMEGWKRVNSGDSHNLVVCLRTRSLQWNQQLHQQISVHIFIQLGFIETYSCIQVSTDCNVNNISKSKESTIHTPVIKKILHNWMRVFRHKDTKMNTLKLSLVYGGGFWNFSLCQRDVSYLVFEVMDLGLLQTEIVVRGGWMRANSRLRVRWRCRRNTDRRVPRRGTGWFFFNTVLTAFLVMYIAIVKCNVVISSWRNRNLRYDWPIGWLIDWLTEFFTFNAWSTAS